MTSSPLRLILISTPIGFIGSGKGGGVELTLVAIIKGLLEMGHHIVLVAPYGSFLPSGCEGAEIITVKGIDQSSWQHQVPDAPITIPFNGMLPKLVEVALKVSKNSDAILNLCYDWLPLWLTPFVEPKIFHLISMAGVSKLMEATVRDLSKTHHSRLAFHTFSQASDYELIDQPIVLGNGFDLKNYHFQLKGQGPLGWAGRVAPEKGLEDAAKVAADLGDKLFVWGLIEDKAYASKIESLVPEGTIEWKGFLNTQEFQSQLGSCRALINTPKWNEAYGNVVAEAMACGVPVVAYRRGGPGELVQSGVTGWLVPSDDIEGLKKGVLNIDKIKRQNCRDWANESASYQMFAKRINSWIQSGLGIR
ncbi:MULTISPECIES: glycosyltransferase family 4 protein [Prochlorococcus]|uniref:Glycosyltransferase n=1 Tax=Prochlorococcus marinus (strain SARG / CCMP1375 / SS120) TaxID=167539 RepID=Q7VB07_PROMA|nr:MULTISPECIES: glycosyltransferase family 4 protein [Prochlorococcus]AAQ00338.1 Glycosyltransferase [Prochlorococcus marinus subsp. marinus str. CCMP1375]